MSGRAWGMGTQAASTLTQKPPPPDPEQEPPALWKAEWDMLNCVGWGLLTLNLKKSHNTKPDRRAQKMAKAKPHVSLSGNELLRFSHSEIFSKCNYYYNFVIHFHPTTFRSHASQLPVTDSLGPCAAHLPALRWPQHDL